MNQDIGVPSKAIRFSNFAWIVLSYTVIVIAWGAYVRATGSGAGCGEHWPLCNGEIIPRDPGTARMIEFSHRLSSGLSLMLVATLFIWARRIFHPGHLARRAAGYSLVFILGEALVGAMLVLLQLVAGNDSVLRAVVIAFHLINTFVLLYWLGATAFLSRITVDLDSSHKHRRARLNVMFCMAAFALTGAAGAIVALGDTLFPVVSLGQGLAQDFSPGAHFLIRLRVWHPVIAVFASFYILLQGLIAPKIFHGSLSPKLGRAVAIMIMIQLFGGIINWLLLAPVWMQLIHLIFADLVWITLCFWFFTIGQDKKNNPGGPL